MNRITKVNPTNSGKSLELAEALVRYRIEAAVNDRQDRLRWQEQAAKEIMLTLERDSD